MIQKMKLVAKIEEQDIQKACVKILDLRHRSCYMFSLIILTDDDFYFDKYGEVSNVIDESNIKNYKLLIQKSSIKVKEKLSNLDLDKLQEGAKELLVDIFLHLT